MTKKTVSSSAQKAQLQRIITIASVVGFVILAGVYLVTGSDPFGLFSESATVTPEAMSRATATPAPLIATPIVEPKSSWWEVHLTDPARINDPEDPTGSVAAELIALIDGAQRTIHIASFEFNYTPVAKALIAAHKRGVEVQWVTDDEYGIEEDEEDDHGQFAMLEDAGVGVRDDSRSALMHNKFWIFDRQTVWTGSTNITVNGFFRNNNNALVIHSPRVAAIYEREFGEMWDDGRFGPTSPSTVDRQSATIDGTPIQVLFASEDEAIDHLVPLIQDAQESIRFMAFSFTDDRIGDVMIERARDGVDVKGIFETRASETEYSELNLLYCARIDVRQDGNPRTFHHKVIIVDDQILITGSLNFTVNGDESNDENVVVITHPEIAARYVQEFDRRWAEASEPEDVSCR